MKKIFSALVVFILIFSIGGQSFAAAASKPYSDKKLGWSINLLPELNKDATDTKANEVNFKDKDVKSGISVFMYSKAGLTLDSWVNKEVNEIKTNYNSNFLKFIKVETGKVNKIPVKKIYVKTLVGSKWVTQCSMYVVGKNYRYIVSYSMQSTDFDVAAKKARMEGAISSFKFTEPNVGTLGTLTESNGAIDSAKRTKIESKELGWALEIPDTWKKVLDSGNLYMYQANNYEMFVMMQADKNVDNKSLDVCAGEFAAEIAKDKANKIVSKKAVKLNGYDCITYSMTVEGYKVSSYVIAANETIYELSVYTANYVDLAKNTKVADNIVNSLKLTDTSAAVAGNSIKDYAALLKGTTKDKIGDSYYNWSFTAPKNLEVGTRSFNGNFTVFALGKDKCYFTVIVLKNEKNGTLDSFSAAALDSAKDEYTIMASEKRKKGDQEYAVLTYRGDSDKFVNEHHTYLVGDMLYTVFLSADEETYNSKKYDSLLSSFECSFIKDGKTEDLSDVNENGLRTFKSRKLKWSIDTLPEWSEVKEQNKENSVQFNIDTSSFIFVNMYSTETGTTLDSWVADELKKKNEVYNKQLVQITGPEDITVNGVKCKRINVSYKMSDKKMYYDSYIYVVGKNYKYFVGYSLEDKIYNDSNLKPKFEKILNSFKFTEPDAKVVGKLFDTENANTSSATHTISSTTYNWSAELPVDFIADKESNDEDYASYSYGSERLSFELSVETAEKTLQEYEASEAKFYSANAAKYTVISSETLNAKGTAVKKYVYKYRYSEASEAYMYINYFAVKNGKVYWIYFSVPEIRYTEFSNKIFTTIWDSVTF